MRQERTVQASLFDLFAGHEIGRELKAMSAWLGDHRELASLVAADLRCALLKQHRQLSYQELAFHLEDAASFRAFARLPHAWSPQKSVLHQTISALRAATWAQIKRSLIASTREAIRSATQPHRAMGSGYRAPPSTGGKARRPPHPSLQVERCRQRAGGAGGADRAVAPGRKDAIPR